VILDSLLIGGIDGWRLTASRRYAIKARQSRNQQSAITNESTIKDHQIFNR
jgi:hypothetical protein